MAEVKIPKKFADICALVRDGREGGIAALNAYPGLGHQREAVLAEAAYFSYDFETALDLDKGLCPFWDEWHYANIRTEHTAAMSFAARALGRQNEIVRFFTGQIALVASGDERPEHIKNAHITNYENRIAYIESGVMPFFSEKETYKPVEVPASLNEIREALIEEKARRKKGLDLASDSGQESLFLKAFDKGSIVDALAIYEKIADNIVSTYTHLNALSGYNHTGDRERAFDVVLRLARQRLWVVASATQVRPMEFFTHPSMHAFLSGKGNLEKITQAAWRI
jgi:hypothetical protein